MTPDRAYAQSAGRQAQQSDAPDWRSRWRQLVGKLHVVHTDQDQEALLERLSDVTKPTTVAFVNAHAMNLAARDAAFYQHLMAADVLLRDGIGMSILMRLLSLAPGRNMNGTDFIPLLLARFSQRSVALFGTKRPFLEAAAESLRQGGRSLPLTLLDGFQPEAAYLQVSAQVRPQLIVLGMGMPKQEAVAAALRSSMTFPVVAVCGGAIVDFLGGKVTRAPLPVRLIGLEWLYRLCLEPRRLFGRYVVGNPVFVARAVLTAFGR